MSTSAKSLQSLQSIENNNFFLSNTHYYLSFWFTRNILIHLIPKTPAMLMEFACSQEWDQVVFSTYPGLSNPPGSPHGSSGRGVQRHPGGGRHPPSICSSPVFPSKIPNTHLKRNTQAAKSASGKASHACFFHPLCTCCDGILNEGMKRSLLSCWAPALLCSPPVQHSSSSPPPTACLGAVSTHLHVGYVVINFTCTKVEPERFRWWPACRGVHQTGHIRIKTHVQSHNQNFIFTPPDFKT